MQQVTGCVLLQSAATGGLGSMLAKPAVPKVLKIGVVAARIGQSACSRNASTLSSVRFNVGSAERSISIEQLEMIADELVLKDRFDIVASFGIPETSPDQCAFQPS